jgi:hypothetical protein
MSKRTVSWFSCGVASAVATKMTLKTSSNVVVCYCETGAEHEDNERFLAECEEWFGVGIIRLKSEKYTDTWELWEKERYLAGVAGAPCTFELKVQPRLDFQQDDDIHVFGYTSDKSDIVRANRFRENYFRMSVATPLIDAGLNKKACLAIIDRAGIRLPIMYLLGFLNNNCIPCVKATSPAYWALIREHFPILFYRMAKLSRQLNVRLCRIGGQRVFIDEIPLNQKTSEPMQPSCDFLCHLAEMGIQ